MTSLFRNGSVAFLVFLMLTVYPHPSARAVPWGDPAEEGVDYFNQENYSKARERFEAARMEDPENPELAYNLANTHYRLGNYDHALSAYSQAEQAITDPAMKQKILYNKGNAYFRSGQTAKAIEAYKQSLAINPEDIDSKYNLEYVRMLQEKAQQSGRVTPQDMTQPPDPNQKGNNPAGENSDSGEEKAETQGVPESPPDPAETSDNEEKQKPDPGTQAEQEPPKSGEDPNGGPPPAGGQPDKDLEKALREATAMSAEEADRWLDSLDEDLKKFSRRQMQGQMKDIFVKEGKTW